MTENAVDQLSAEAAEIAARNTPLRVLAILILGIFTVVGFILGRTWLIIAGSVTYVGLSIRYGYVKGRGPKNVTAAKK